MACDNGFDVAPQTRHDRGRRTRRDGPSSLTGRGTHLEPVGTNVRNPLNGQERTQFGKQPTAHYSHLDPRGLRKLREENKEGRGRASLLRARSDRHQGAVIVERKKKLGCSSAPGLDVRGGKHVLGQQERKG